MTLIWYFSFAWIPIVAFIRIKECVVAIIGLNVQQKKKSILQFLRSQAVSRPFSPTREP